MSMKNSTEAMFMTAADLNSAIGQLKGRVLSSVEFVQDYVQLRFDGPCLTAYTHPIFNPGTECLVWGASGFESGAVISVSLLDEDYIGPEAVQFTSEDGSIWIG